MRYCASIKTSDGKLFAKENEKEAINHEYLLALRGAIQSSEYAKVFGLVKFSTDDVAKLIMRDSDNIKDIMYKFKRKLDGLNQRKTVGKEDMVPVTNGLPELTPAGVTCEDQDSIYPE